MSNGDLFYICGVALAVSAVVTSLIGLKVKDFPGKAFPIVILWFAILIGAATTFAVLHAKDEDKAKAAEIEKAGKEFEAEGTTTPPAKPRQRRRRQGGRSPKPSAIGPGRDRSARRRRRPTSPSTRPNLSSKPGKVTIDFDNPAALEHNVAIEQDGKELADSETLAEGKTSVSAELAPGTYTFLCTIPGHARSRHGRNPRRQVAGPRR